MKAFSLYFSVCSKRENIDIQRETGRGIHPLFPFRISACVSSVGPHIVENFAARGFHNFEKERERESVDC